ncbi:MAG: formylglycine-generating enzyme family protein [Fibrobacterota bacterium]
MSTVFSARFFCFSIVILALCVSCWRNPVDGDTDEDHETIAGMIRIPAAGTNFIMGAGDGWEERNQQAVRFTSDFYISATCITQKEYEAIVGNNPSQFSGANRPVEMVSWYDAARYCNARSRSEGREPVYQYDGGVVHKDTEEDNWQADVSKNGYRLPTEAEWEYAAQGGVGHEYGTHDGVLDLDRANYRGNGIHHTTDVKTYAPNPFGLYDMAGNIQQWCTDWYGNYSDDAVVNPSGPVDGYNRVVRGGSWYNNGQFLRAGSRSFASPNEQNDILGFRVVITP